jgi:Transglutaminase-like superfamily
MTGVRRFVPYTLLPLSLIACVLASAPWLRAFPASVLAVPLFGAAVLSVLAPVVVVGIGVRPLWLTALIDIALFVFYTLLVGLRDPSGYGHLWTGLVHGPAQILSFALPLMSPRTLLVAPIALCWLSGALIGECVARGWQSVLPYLTLLVTFGLAYAATARAVTNATDLRRYDTLFAAVLLVALLLLRTAQAWIAQDESAETTQPDGVLPVRGVAVGALLAVAVAAAAAGLVQASAFAGRPEIPARVPPVDESRPLTPVAFVSDLRPDDPTDRGQLLFTVNTDRATANYLAIASVDYYDGDSWSFSRTFRPSGGVVPADPDPAMRPSGSSVTQQYEIADGPMTTVPWMPHLDRPQRVTGVAVNIDADSGMIVPAQSLRAGDAYTVTSTVPGKDFDRLGKGALLGTSASQLDTTLPNGLTGPLGALVRALSQETGVPFDSPIPFLQAVVKELRAQTTLAGGPSTSSVAPSGSASSSPSPSEPPAHTGGTAFADVLASIRGSRAATPEQFATFIALVARELNVPARVVSGFRLPTASGASTIPPGTYAVTSTDAWTWVEIPVRGLGWVVLDAAPSRYSNQAPEPTAGATRSSSPSPTPSQNALVTRSNNGGHAVAPPSRTPHSTGISTTALIMIVLAAALFAGVLLLAALVIRKRLRLQRRRHGDPRRRAVGAWQESIDLLVEAGLPDLSCATTSEVETFTAVRFGAESASRARAVGAAADVAIFHPSTALALEDADDAWLAHDELSRTVRRSLSWPDRVVARLRYNRASRRRSVVRSLRRH